MCVTQPYEGSCPGVGVKERQNVAGGTVGVEAAPFPDSIV
jgi:hypothetical protein